MGGEEAIARAGVAQGWATAFAPRIQIRSNLWNNWARIAITHEREAVRELARLHATWGVAGADTNILAEMHPSMVAIVAAADAIDALHGDIAPALGRDPQAQTRGRRWGYMLNTFQHGYRAAHGWQADFKWLFGARGNAVHFRGESRDVVPHPDLPTNVAVENVLFSARGASRALDIMLAVFGVVLRGETNSVAAAEWGRRRMHVLVELDEIHARG